MKLRRRWVRSWPTDLQPLIDRSYIIDKLPRLEMITNYDLAENPESWTVLRDCTLLEWDIAVSPECMMLWEDLVDQRPDRVHVAPYRVYADSGYGADGWMPPMVPSRPEPGGTPVAMFGFGMIWFPAEVLDRFHAAPHNPAAMWFTDGTFSAWYIAHYGAALAHWNVQPVHLNYRLELPP